MKTISRETYVDMIRAWGFEPDDLISLRLDASGIYAEGIRTSYFVRVED